MRRTTMVSMFPMLASLGLAVLLAVPSDGMAGQMAGWTMRPRPALAPVAPWNSGSVLLGPRGFPDAKARDRRHGSRHRWRGDRRDRFDGYIYFPYFGYNDYYDQDSPLALPPAPTLPPEPPVVEAPAEPPPPPDPRGPLRLTAARGVAPAEPLYALGEPLPPDLPHVTLDWRQYDLPEPPAGRLYARIGRDVLLITEVDRVVEKVVDL